MITFTSNKSNFYLHQQRSVALKYAKNALAAGAPPWTPLGRSRRSPRPTSRLGRGTPPPQTPLPRLLSRLNPPACCARFSTRAVPLFETFRRPCVSLWSTNSWLDLPCRRRCGVLNYYTELGLDEFSRRGVHQLATSDCHLVVIKRRVEYTYLYLLRSSCTLYLR